MTLATNSESSLPLPEFLDPRCRCVASPPRGRARSLSSVTLSQLQLYMISQGVRNRAHTVNKRICGFGSLGGSAQKKRQLRGSLDLSRQVRELQLMVGVLLYGYGGYGGYPQSHVTTLRDKVALMDGVPRAHSAAQRQPPSISTLTQPTLAQSQQIDEAKWCRPPKKKKHCKHAHRDSMRMVGPRVGGGRRRTANGM